MKDREEPLSDWELERLRLEELPTARLEAARRRLEAEPGGAERLARLEASDRALLEALPPDEVAREVARRSHRLEVERAFRRESRRRWVMAVPVMATAALALIVLRLPGGGELETPAQTGPAAVVAPGDGGLEGPDQVREKGRSPHLRIYRRQGERVERLAPRAPARAGEVLQLAIVAAGKPYGVVLSIDGAGTITRHLPEETDGAARLEPSGELKLPHAYELDEAPGFERFFLVTSSRPFPVARVLEAARTLAGTPEQARVRPLSLPEGLEQSSILLEKVSR